MGYPVQNENNVRQRNKFDFVNQHIWYDDRWFVWIRFFGNIFDDQIDISVHFCTDFSYKKINKKPFVNKNWLVFAYLYVMNLIIQALIFIIQDISVTLILSLTELFQFCCHDLL